MKIIVTVAIFVLLVAPTTASFFNNFHGAISTVHNGFGKFFSHVVNDVSETIGCTILAVKQVLALDGSYHESSDYNTRCRGQNAVITDSGNESPLNPLNEQKAQFEIQNIEAQLKKQTDRLWAISNLLRRELDNIPSDIKIKFRVREPDPTESIVGRIWSDLKLLHDIEHSNIENTSEINEIHQVLDTALGIMQINKTSSNESDDDKIKSIVRDIEKESNDTTIHVEEEFTQWDEEESDENSRSNNVKNTNKDNTKDIIEDTKEEYSVDSNNSFEKTEPEELFVELISTMAVASTTIVTTTTTIPPITTTTTVAPTTVVTTPTTITPLTTTTTVVPTTVVPTTTTIAPSISTTTVASTTIATTPTTIAPSTSTTTVAPTTIATTPTTIAPSTSRTIASTTVTTTVAFSTSSTPTTTVDPDFYEFQKYVLEQMGPQNNLGPEQAAAEAQKLITDSKYRNTIFKYLKSADDTDSNVFDHPELFNF